MYNRIVIIAKSPFVFAAEVITNVLDFKREAGLWHGVLTVSGLPLNKTKRCVIQIIRPETDLSSVY